VGSLGHGQFAGSFYFCSRFRFWLIVCIPFAYDAQRDESGFQSESSRRRYFEASQLRVKRDLVGSERVTDHGYYKMKPPQLITYFVYGGVGVNGDWIYHFCAFIRNRDNHNRFFWFHMFGFLIATGIYLLI